MGAAQAGIFSCSTSSIAQWFPGTRRAVASGALASFMSVGGAVGAILTGLLLDQISWRWLFFLFALPGVVWAAWFFLWFRDRPQDHRAVSAGELALIRPSAPHPIQDPVDESREPTPWGLIFTSSAMWWICGQQFFRAAGYIFFTSWFATFLKETRGVTTAQAGILNSLPLWGVVLGSLAGGAASDWLLVHTGSRQLSRQGLAVLSQLACALFIFLAYPIENAWLAVLVISAGSFFAAMAGPCAYTVTIDMGGKHIPTVFSMMNMSGNLGAMVFPLLVPWLVRLAGNWGLVLFVFAGVYLAAGACWLPINPNRTVFDRSGRRA
jgi:ACS family glucarate transporter-like MFS transporter